MSKKPKHSRHRVPAQALVVRSDPVDERYQVEVDYATTRLQRRYERSLKARDAVLRRLRAAIERNAKASYLAELRRQLEIREYELEEIVKLMQPGNRQRVPWRPVPVAHQGFS